VQSIGIIGAGAWGTALALVALRAGRAVTIWAREPEVARDIAEAHANTAYLPGIALDPAIRTTTDLAVAARSDALLLAVPAQFLRATLTELADHVAPATPAVICAKGIEQTTGALMSEVAAAALPRARLAILSGPTFAHEVARDLPTAVTLACHDVALGEALVTALGSTTFRPYLGTDLVGVQLGGAVKNVLAIGCGIVEGRGLGENARAALITRGLAEMTRLAVAMGGRTETTMGLSGLGDLVLTCAGASSRNTSLGVALGRGERLADILARRSSVAEGVSTAPAVVSLAERFGIDMPISRAVDAILHRGQPIDAAVAGLLARPFRAEALAGN
jgi:glycerol-3-phosphate dehydrogenase (NAD(P)+)